MIVSLDLGGVLVHDPFHELFEDLSAAGGVPAEVIQEWYEQNLRWSLWSGTISEEEFWKEILAESRVLGEAAPWRERLIQSLRFLPAAARIRDIYDVGLLYSVSNHRHEWIRPLLRESGLEGYFEDIIISSEVGEVVPDRAIWNMLVERSGESPRNITVVDNLERNLRVPESMEMDVVLADPDGDWIELL
jgi:FMN phosphatase YigB (HAD superfamily)